MARQKKEVSRAEEIRANRRRKPGNLQYGGGRLDVNENVLEREKFEYRWVSDRAGRAQKLHEQDWDRVNDPEAKPDADAQGTVISVHGGAEDSGKPYQQVLMRKHKVLYDDDQEEKMKPMAEVDEQLARNQAGQIAAQTDRDLANHAYVPGGGNSLKVSRGIKPS